MPKRVIDFDAMWSSDKLAACAPWAQAEYAWLYGLADASGCFELTNLRVIWGRVAAIRKSLSLERLEQIFDEFRDKGLLFVWEENGKRYGHWTNSDRPGRLPAPSWRNRLERLAPPVPHDALAQYQKAFANARTFPTNGSAEPPAPLESGPAPRHGRDCRGAPITDAFAINANLNPSLETAQGQDWERNKNGKGKDTQRPAADVRVLTPPFVPLRHPENAGGVIPREVPRGGTSAGPNGIGASSHATDPRALLEIYEQERGALPPSRGWTQQRAGKCRARLGQRGFALEDFRAAVRRAGQTPFLCGGGERGWRASFDWLIANDTNFVKVLEGRYDAAESAGAVDPAARLEFDGDAGVVGAGPRTAREDAARRAACLGASPPGIVRVKPEILERIRQRDAAVQAAQRRVGRGAL